MEPPIRRKANVFDLGSGRFQRKNSDINERVDNAINIIV
jgi:hypothetical protein